MENQAIYDKKRSFIVNFCYILIVGGLIYIGLKYAIPLVLPFVLALLTAYIINKPSRFLSEKLHVKRKFVSILMVLLFYSTIGLLVALAGIKIVTSLGALISYMPTAYNEHIEPAFIILFAWLERSIPDGDSNLAVALTQLSNSFIQSLGKLVTDLSVSAVGLISGYAASLPALLIKTLFMIIATFFLAADYEKVTGFAMRQFSSKVRNLCYQIKEYIIGTLFVCIRSYLLIMTITFMELSLGFYIIGVDNFFATALFIAIFDILPVLGTGGIMVPWIIICLLQGNIPMAIGLACIYGIVTIVRNILEPKIVGSQIGLHPLATLISMFVGVQLFGVIGLFGFPITLSLLMHLNRNGTIHLFK